MKMVQLRVDKSKLYSGLFVGLAFLAFTALTVKFFAPDVATNADTATQTVGPYTMSMSNDDSVSLDITPTDSQAIYTVTNELSLTNSCDAGATITITTASGSLNSLVRSGLDSLTKEILATTSSNSLSDNSWGYSIDGGTTYHAVPKLGDTAATVYTSDNSQVTALSVPVIFGVKTDSNLPSGAYTNDVVYTMAPNPGCLVYAVTWDLDGGVAAEGATYPTSLAWGETVDLTGLTPTREGYTFNGWSNGSSTFTGNETEADVNAGNAKTVTVKPNWVGTCAGGKTPEVLDLAVNGSKTYSYSGTENCVMAVKAGRYKLEVWGSQGNAVMSNESNGALGGYSTGTATFTANQVIYINAGGNNGYNGGGTTGGVGGGATHIAKASGLLASLSGNKSSVLIVAGGGGGSAGWGHDSTFTVRKGGAGGGTSGGGGQSSSCGCTSIYQSGTLNWAPSGTGATASAGGSGYASGSFGKGANAGSYGGSGGGGWYGGGSGAGNWYLYGQSGCPCGGPGGGGSGYVGGVSGGSMSNGARSGNGQAKITYLGN